VVFSGRTWRLVGQEGSRKLENVATEAGELWGICYEEAAEALANPYRLAG